MKCLEVLDTCIIVSSSEIHSNLYVIKIGILRLSLDGRWFNLQWQWSSEVVKLRHQIARVVSSASITCAPKNDNSYRARA